MNFEYAGTRSRIYDLYIASIEESRNLDVSGAADIVTLFNKRTEQSYYIDTLYDKAPMEFEMEVVSERPLSIPRQRAVTKWLFHRHGFKRLYVDAGDDIDMESAELVSGQIKRTFLNCIFTSPVKIESGDGVHGYRFHVVCDSACGWQDEITQSFDFDQDGGDSIITITVDTDMHEYVYPKMQIDMDTSGGDLTIVNHTDSDSRITAFSSLDASQTFVMDGRVNYISSDDLYKKFTNRNFVRLVDGKNTLSISGSVKKITFEWQNRRYL